jgi:hypothetical protein
VVGEEHDVDAGSLTRPDYLRDRSGAVGVNRVEVNDAGEVVKQGRGHGGDSNPVARV